MTEHAFPGLRADSLLTYLAALGLTRIIAEQADRGVRTWWKGDHLHMETTIDDVRDVLVEAYRPSPVFSPWNGGSGFGEKDRNQRAALEKIAATNDERLADFTRGYQAALEVETHRAEAAAQGRPWEKERHVIELRNRLPERALAWLDAVVVVGGDRLHFPSVYGTGGNDGRLEFSSNFHQRLIDVIPELGAKPATSLAWATDALTDAGKVALKAAPAGQFDPLGAASPGTWSVGTPRSLVNPWLYILMIEACGYLAASLTRAGQGQPRASVPFTVAPSAVGPTAGSDTEANRGEFWAPMWDARLHHLELRQLFGQARASWAGRTPTTSAGMYAAARSSGVDDRIVAFSRYAIAQRNGLAFVTAPRDRVVVRARPGIDIAIPLEARMSRFLHGSSGRAQEQGRRLQRCEVAFVSTEDRHAATGHLVDWLAALTAREHAAGLSDRERDAITGAPRSPRAIDALSHLGPWLEEQSEHRIAASLASGVIGETPTGPATTLRDLVIGCPPRPGRREWREPVVAGYGVRPLVEVLADLAVWRDHHAGETARARGVGRGVRPITRHRYRCRRSDVTRWLRGELDEPRVAHAFSACLALDWTSWVSAPATRERDVPDPAFAALAAVGSGAIILPGYAADDPAPDARQGWPAGWALRLRAGHVGEVVADAVALLNRSRIAPARRLLPEDTAVGPEEAAGDATERRRHHPERRLEMSMPIVAAYDRGLGVRLAAALLTPLSIDHAQRLGYVHAVNEPRVPLTRADDSAVDPSHEGALS